MALGLECISSQLPLSISRPRMIDYLQNNLWRRPLHPQLTRGSHSELLKLVHERFCSQLFPPLISSRHDATVAAPSYEQLLVPSAVPPHHQRSL